MRVKFRVVRSKGTYLARIQLIVRHISRIFCRTAWQESQRIGSSSAVWTLSDTSSGHLVLHIFADGVAAMSFWGNPSCPARSSPRGSSFWNEVKCLNLLCQAHWRPSILSTGRTCEWDMGIKRGLKTVLCIFCSNLMDREIVFLWVRSLALEQRKAFSAGWLSIWRGGGGNDVQGMFA